MNQPIKLLDQVRNLMRVKHYSLSAERQYIHWMKRYIFYHQKKHPKDMNESHVQAFLTHLAVNRKIAASTQNQALNALARKYPNAAKEWRWQSMSHGAMLNPANDLGFKPLNQAQRCIRLCFPPGRIVGRLGAPLAKRPIQVTGITASETNHWPGPTARLCCLATALCNVTLI